MKNINSNNKMSDMNKMNYNKKSKYDQHEQQHEKKHEKQR